MGSLKVALQCEQRILFKITVLVFQCPAGQAPSYLSDDRQPVSDSRPRRLRSSDSLSCVVRHAHNTYGDRCFATAGPRVWNSLPAELQQRSSLRQFKWCLKTFLFRLWDYGALWLFVKQRRIEIVLLTYLIPTFYTLSLFFERMQDGASFGVECVESFWTRCSRRSIVNQKLCVFQLGSRLRHLLTSVMMSLSSCFKANW